MPADAFAASSAAKPSTVLPRPHVRTPVRLSELAPIADAVLHGSDTGVHGVTLASGRVQPGDLFAAVPGRLAHGARYVGEAVARGAVAVITDADGAALVRADALTAELPLLVSGDVRASLGPTSAAVYGFPSRRLRMLGVTGTSGKTTTTYLVRAGLRAAGQISGLIGTVATMLGEQEIYTGFTTPEAPDVQALLAVMAERGVTTVAMEVSSHALALGRADGIDFAVAAFTNLSQDHLDFHPDMESYFAAKSRLFDGRARHDIVVTDDDWGKRLAVLAGPGTTTVNTTGSADATWRALDIEVAVDGSTRFRAVGPGVDIVAGCRVPGTYNVANALLALAILDAAAVPIAVAAPAVSGAQVPGRMERVDAGQPYLAVVDYSHKPAAVDGALRALRPLTPGRLVIVLGCGGDRDTGKRAVMGQVAAAGADLLVITDDNPRSEGPGAIRHAMLEGALQAATRGAVVEIGGRAAAIAAAVQDAVAGDTILVAGKGHETGQEIAGVIHPFDDRVELRQAIQAAAGQIITDRAAQ